MLLAIACPALAQENVPILFLPPPMDGTISTHASEVGERVIEVRSIAELNDAEKPRE